MRQPKLQSQSPYLIVPKGMGSNAGDAKLPGINKMVASVSKPTSSQGNRPKTHESGHKN